MTGAHTKRARPPGRLRRALRRRASAPSAIITGRVTEASLVFCGCGCRALHYVALPLFHAWAQKRADPDVAWTLCDHPAVPRVIPTVHSPGPADPRFVGGPCRWCLSLGPPLPTLPVVP